MPSYVIYVVATRNDVTNASKPAASKRVRNKSRRMREFTSEFWEGYVETS